MSKTSKTTQTSGKIKPLLPIVFFGTEDFSAVALDALLKAEYAVSAVVTKPDAPKGRGQKLVAPKMKQIAETHNIPVLQPQKLQDIYSDLTALTPAAGVLVSYGKILPQSIIDLFTPGIINLHPSILPKYRGPSPIESAILNGDQETGVTVMQLTAKMDAGPIYAFAPLELTGRETRKDLYGTLGDLGAHVLVATLPQIINDGIAPNPQDDSEATYCRLLSKDDSWLKPDTMTATEAERRVRAHLGFPKTKIHIDGQDIIITKAHVALKASTRLDVRFSDGKYLAIEEVVAPSGKTMTADAYLRGRHSR